MTWLRRAWRWLLELDEEPLGDDEFLSRQW